MILGVADVWGKRKGFDVFLEFEIPFDECLEYMKTRNRRIVKRGWDTIKVKVAVDKG